MLAASRGRATSFLFDSAEPLAFEQENALSSQIGLTLVLAVESRLVLPCLSLMSRPCSHCLSPIPVEYDRTGHVLPRRIYFDFEKWDVSHQDAQV